LSGVAGGNRIQKVDVQSTFNKYIKTFLEKIPGFKLATLSGSVKVGTKPDYGDLDLIVYFEGDDKKEVKQRLIKQANSSPNSLIVPFKSEKYTGKKYYNSGEIITVLFPIEGKPGEFIQVDNIIALSEEEHAFKNNFLDLPAEKQGLILGLSKVVLLEENPAEIFKRLSIGDLPTLDSNEEFEFNLSSNKLTLRKVKLENFSQVSREDLWSSTNWDLIKELFRNYNLDANFDELLAEIGRKVKNPRSKSRIKGIFNSMVSVKTGEVGTEKAKGKEYALNAVNTLLEDENIDYKDLLSQTEKEALEIVHKNWDVFDGKECNKGFCDIFAYKLQKRLPGSVIMHTEEMEGPNESFGHVWLEYKGKYYDAETPKGVSTWKKLPWMKAFNVKNKRYPSDVENLTEEVSTGEVIALYAGGFKPPHRAHFNNARILAGKADKLIIFIGPKIREGIRISPEQSEKIWQIYAEYLNVPVEIRISSVTPVRDIYDFVDQNKDNYSKIITGALEEELAKFIYFEKNREKYPNVEVLVLPKIGDEENKLSATTMRSSVRYLKNGEWIPDEIGEKGRKAVTQIAMKNAPTEQEILMHEALNTTLDNMFETQEEESSKDFHGAAIKPGEVVSSEQRAELADTYGQILNLLGNEEYEINFNGDHIIVKRKTEKGTVGHDYTPYMASILEHMIKEGMKVVPIPEVCIKRDASESANFFGRTAYYDPDEKKVVLYVEGRHPKDIMRSFTHEMIHHMQNLEGRLGQIESSDTNSSTHLREIEEEAYLKGNITFRNWEDKVKNLGKETSQDIEKMKTTDESIRDRGGRTEETISTLASKYNVGVSTILGKLANGAKIELKDNDFSEDLAMQQAFNMLSKDINYYNRSKEEIPQIMSEGRYDTITNQVSSDIFRYWKNNIDSQEDSIVYEESYDNNDVAFDVKAVLVVEEGYGKLTMDGGADYSAEAEYDDYIEAVFTVDPEMLPEAWEIISMNLKDIIRHEIEHLTHSDSDNTKTGKFLEDDNTIRALVKAGIVRNAEYFKLEKEVDANIQGLYYKAKKQKVSFAAAAEEYLKGQDITLQEKEEIKELWRKRLPALGIKEKL